MLDRYYTREDAEASVRYINGTRLDDRIIRADWDAGFKEGRQYGRGKSGGQVSVSFVECHNAANQTQSNFGVVALATGSARVSFIFCTALIGHLCSRRSRVSFPFSLECVFSHVCPMFVGER